MDLTPMLDHLSQLEWNNNREWFRAHSRERKAARADFEGLVLGLMLGLAQEQPGILDYRPADLTYSLVRDPRRPHPGGEVDLKEHAHPPHQEISRRQKPHVPGDGSLPHGHPLPLSPYAGEGGGYAKGRI